jgi:hypothetical protein
VVINKFEEHMFLRTIEKHKVLYPFNITWNRYWGSCSSDYEGFCFLGYTAMRPYESQPVLLLDCFMLVFWFAYSLTLEMEEISASCWFFAWLTLWPWRWRWCVPPEHQFAFTGLYGITS